MAANICIVTPRVNNMGEGECLMLYRVVKNDCVNSKGFLSDMQTCQINLEKGRALYTGKLISC